MANLLALAWNCFPKKAFLAPEETQHSSIDLGRIYSDVFDVFAYVGTYRNQPSLLNNTSIKHLCERKRNKVKVLAQLNSQTWNIFECWASCRISTPNSVSLPYATKYSKWLAYACIRVAPSTACSHPVDKSLLKEAASTPLRINMMGLGWTGGSGTEVCVWHGAT